jgi:hypothetical protein
MPLHLVRVVLGDRPMCRLVTVGALENLESLLQRRALLDVKYGK